MGWEGDISVLIFCKSCVTAQLRPLETELKIRCWQLWMNYKQHRPYCKMHEHFRLWMWDCIAVWLCIRLSFLSLAEYGHIFILSLLDWDWRRVKSCFCWGVSGWIRSASVPGPKERERTCTYVPRCLLLLFFCVGCKLSGFKCTQVYKGHVRWELLNTHNSGKCGGKEVSKSIDISTLKRAHLKSASSLLFSSYLFGSLMPLASPCFVPFLSFPHISSSLVLFCSSSPLFVLYLSHPLQL